MRSSRPKYYKLIGRLAVPVRDHLEWAEHFEKNRVVFQDEIGPLFVSTIFMGFDHNWSLDPDAPAILFETMIFGADENDSYQRRYATWDDAEKGHAEAVAYARELVAAADAAIRFKAGSDQ